MSEPEMYGDTDLRKKACKHEWVIYFCNKKADECGAGTLLSRIEMIKPDEIPQDFSLCKCGAVSYIRHISVRPYNKVVIAEITNA